MGCSTRERSISPQVISAASAWSLKERLPTFAALPQRGQSWIFPLISSFLSECKLGCLSIIMKSRSPRCQPQPLAAVVSLEKILRLFGEPEAFLEPDPSALAKPNGLAPLTGSGP